MKRVFGNLGPGVLIAAAFIGPGTVTVCTLAGVKFGFTLLWAMVLSIVATLVLQEMAARLGLVSGRGLAETVKDEISNKVLRVFAIALIVSAILLGNAAYEAGNISGGVLGLQGLLPDMTFNLVGTEINSISLIIGLLAFLLLYIGKYKVIERSLVTLVIFMSFSFLIAAFLTKPNIGAILNGIFVPRFPAEGMLTIVALVGTTVVPYNLFLHASLVHEKWNDTSSLTLARKDLYISVVLGGIVSLAIIICGAAITSNTITDVSQLAQGLEPLFGSFAKYFLSLGLFAAGITSAITAPLAAAYVARGCFGWDASLKSARFRGVWMSVLAIGVVFSSLGFKPIEIIKFAQIANGILLPVIAGFLLWIVNRNSIMGSYKNSGIQNVLGILIVGTAFLLGAISLLKVFKLL